MYNVWTDADEDRAGEEIYAAADRVIDGLERKIEVLETRLAAADALAVAVLALRHMHHKDGRNRCIFCDHPQHICNEGHNNWCARYLAQQYREVSK